MFGFFKVSEDLFYKELLSDDIDINKIQKYIEKGTNVEVATAVGKLVAEKALKAGIETVTFDRGGYLYHGRIKSLAEGARAAGLKF